MPDLGLLLDALRRKARLDRPSVRGRINDPTFPTAAALGRVSRRQRVVVRTGSSNMARVSWTGVPWRGLGR